MFAAHKTAATRKGDIDPFCSDALREFSFLEAEEGFFTKVGELDFEIIDLLAEEGSLIGRGISQSAHQILNGPFFTQKSDLELFNVRGVFHGRELSFELLTQGSDFPLHENS